MGEARRRGTFEQRKAAAIARDGLTKEQKQQQRQAHARAYELMKRRALDNYRRQLFGALLAGGAERYRRPL